MDLTFLAEAVSAYQADRVELPEALLAAAQALEIPAFPYTLASAEYRTLGLICYYKDGVLVGRQNP